MPSTDCFVILCFVPPEEIQTDVLLEATTHALNGLQRFCFFRICSPKTTTPGTTKPKIQGNWSSSNSVPGYKG